MRELWRHTPLGLRIASRLAYKAKPLLRRAHVPTKAHIARAMRVCALQWCWGAPVLSCAYAALAPPYHLICRMSDLATCLLF